jgi:WD40 repeat protein
LSIASDGVRIWNLAGNGEIRTIELPGRTFGSNTASMVGANGAIGLTREGSSAFGSIYHFDAETGAVEQRLDDVTTGQSIAVSPDGRRLAAQSTSGDAFGPVHLFDNETGQLLAEMEGMCVYVDPVGGESCVLLPGLPFEEWIWNMSFNADGSKLASGGYSRSVSVWDSETGRLEWNSGLLPGSEGQVTTVDFHPSDDVLAYADFEQITLLDVTDYTVIRSRPAETFVRHMEFSPDGDYLVTATQDSNLVWYSTDTLDEAGRFDLAHDGVIKDLDVTADGLIVSGGSDGFARVWDIESGQLVQAIPFDDAVQNVVVLNNSELFITPFTGPGLVMTIDVEDLIDTARRRVTRSFTATECDTYHIEVCPTLDQLRGG